MNLLEGGGKPPPRSPPPTTGPKVPELVEGPLPLLAGTPRNAPRRSRRTTQKEFCLENVQIHYFMLMFWKNIYYICRVCL